MATTSAMPNSAATMSATQSASVGGPGFLGIAATSVDNCGILVGGLVPGAAATAANIQVGDVIVAVNGQSVASIMSGSASTSSGTGSSTGMATAAATTAMTTPNANGAASMSIQPFATFIQSFQAGQTITLTIQRNGQQ